MLRADTRRTFSAVIGRRGKDYKPSAARVKIFGAINREAVDMVLTTAR